MTTATPTVLHLIAPGPYGGAESVVRALALGRADRGCPTHVGALVPGADHPFVADLRARGFPAVAVPAPPRRYLRHVADVKRLIRDRGVDVVHTHGYHGNVIGVLAARGTGRRVVATSHGITAGSLRNRFYEWVNTRFYNRCDRVICVSNSNRDEVVGQGVRRALTVVATNGFMPEDPLDGREARRRLGVPESGPVIAWVGRMSGEKGPDLLIEALGRLNRADVTTVVIGDGPARGALEAQIERVAPGGPVHLVGRRTGVPGLLAGCDLLVLSSRTEGTPIVLLEAVHAGAAVVAFAVGGVPDVVGPDEAWLAPPGDTRALARAIAEAVDDGEARARRVAAARSVVEARFGLSGWLDRMEAIYDEVTGAAAA